MNTDKTGGPAFPRAGAALDTRSYQELKGLADGMTLRDYFAAKAMQALLIDVSLHAEDLPSFAASAYMMADAMLKARES